MWKKRIVSLVITTILVLSTIILVSNETQSNPGIIYVDDDTADYTVIQKAIDNAFTKYNSIDTSSTNLSKGWNSIIILSNKTFYAKDIGITLGGPAVCDAIVMWINEKDNYICHPVGTLINNFAINSQAKFYIHIQSNISFDFIAEVIINKGDPPPPPQFHYIAGSATYNNNGPADGANVTVINSRTSEALYDIVGPEGNSGTSGEYLVDLEELTFGYEDNDLIMVYINGTGDFLNYQGYNSTYVNINMVAQIVHVILYQQSPPSYVWVDDDFNNSVIGWQFDHFDIIQDGIYAVADSGTVYVYNGTYYEHINVNKDIDLIGEDKNTTIIDGSGTGVVVLISINGVNMSHFTMRNAGTSHYITPLKITSDNNIICHTIIENYDWGIYLHNSNYNIIHHNIINNHVRLEPSGNNQFHNNTFNSSGLRSLSSGYSIYENNYFQDSSLELNPGSSHNIVRYNYFNSSALAPQQYSHYNEIYGNLFINGYFGITDYVASHDTVVYHNNFINSTINIKWGGNYMYNPTLQEGNYYSNYTGNDSNGDGIGDTPYDVPGAAGIQDLYPLINPWSLDETPPEISNVEDYPDPQTSGNSLEIICNVTDNVGIYIVKTNITYPDSTSHNITMIHISGTDTYYYNTTYSLAGNYSYFIWAIDTLGNSNTSLSYNFTILDTTPPDESGAWITIDGGAVYSTDTTLDFVWGGFVDNESGIAGYYYSFTDSSPGPGSVWTTSTSGQLSGAPDGVVNVYVWAKDNAGNIGVAVFDTIIVDAHPPVITGIMAFPDCQEPGGFVNISCDVNDNVGVGTVVVNISYPGGSCVNMSMNSAVSGSYYYNASYSQRGNYSYFIWANDTAGSSNTSLSYNFTITGFTLNITTVGNGNVTKNPDQDTYTYGTTVTLTAIPDTGWSFIQWSGDLTGSTNPDTITMTGDKTVTAIFIQDQYTLTINIMGSGTVTKNPDQTTYTYGTMVTLTAIPGTNWNFSHWSGDLIGSTNPSTITMTGHKIVTATFNELIIDYILITYKSGNEIPNQNISTGLNLTGYAKAIYENLDFISVNWSVTNSGSSANTNPLTGTSSTFYSGLVNGTALWTIDDGNGHSDTVEFTINSSLYSMVFYQGWNLVTIPFGNSWTAEALGENITGCTTVAMFSASTQTFLTHVVGVPHDDFPIVDGVGYFVYCTQDSIFSIPDSLVTSANVPIFEDWNTIGWYHDYLTTAESLGQSISGTSVVAMFDPVSQTFLSHVVGTPHDNFTIERGMGLFIYTDEASIWHGEG